MKLYFATGTCSLASYIALEELGLPFQAVRVNLKEKTLADGADYKRVNPKGYVPTVVLDDGEVLTENSALLAYLGERDPKHVLIPAAGTLGNYRVREWLAYINSEVHKTVSPLFRPNTPEVTVKAQLELFDRRLKYIEPILGQHSYLTGEHFTVADAYLFVILHWFPRLKLDLADYPNLKNYHDRLMARPAITRALEKEAAAA